MSFSICHVRRAADAGSVRSRVAESLAQRAPENTNVCRFHDAESLFHAFLCVNRRRGRVKREGECSTPVHATDNKRSSKTARLFFCYHVEQKFMGGCQRVRLIWCETDYRLSELLAIYFVCTAYLIVIL